MSNLSSHWAHEDSITIAASPDRIWSLWAYVPSWLDWYATLSAVSIDGNFTEGTSLSIHRPNTPLFVGTLRDIEPGVSFANDITWTNGAQVCV